MNLLSNAIKYNKPGGSISVHAKIIRQVHQNVIYKFIISDTGIGISPEFQKHIFEPFAQEDTGARTIYKGTGAVWRSFTDWYRKWAVRSS